MPGDDDEDLVGRIGEGVVDEGTVVESLHPRGAAISSSASGPSESKGGCLARNAGRLAASTPVMLPQR